MSQSDAIEPPVEREPAAILTWVPVVGVVLLLGGVARFAAAPLADPDVWWHLRLGRDFWEGRSLSAPGSLGSFSTAEWVPTQWLTEMVAAKVESWFGLPGVAWLFGFTLMVLIVSVYAVCRVEASPVAAALVTAVAFLGMSGSLTPRPHMLSYIFLTITVGAWLRTTRDLKPRWWLIAVAWLWACSHGMWFVGPVTGLVVAIGILLDRRSRQAARLIAIPLASAAVAMVTPVGPRLITTPFAVAGISEYITEWAAPSIRDLGPAVAAVMLAVVVVGWSRGPQRSWAHLGLLLLAGGWMLLAARTVTLGVIFVAPLLAGVIHSWVPGRAVDRVRPGERRAIIAGTAVFLFILAVTAPRYAPEPGGLPLALSRQLGELPRGTVVLNSYQLGGWLEWAYADLEPVVDSLTESYTSAYLGHYVDATWAVPGWREFVEDSGATAALLDETLPLAAALEDQLDWVTVGSDNGIVLLMAPSH